MQDKRSKSNHSRFLRVLALLALFVALMPFLARWKAQNDFASTPARAEKPLIQRITAPIRLASNPTLVLERGIIRMTGTDKAGRARRAFFLERALFRLDTSSNAIGAGSGKAALGLVTPLIGALKKLGFETLTISRSAIIFGADPGAYPKSIRKLEATITDKRDGVIKAKGGFRYNGHDVTFTAEIKPGVKAEAEGRLPFSFDVTSRLLNSSFADGSVSLANGLELRGKMKFASPNLRRALKWLTGNFPKGPGLEDVKAQGQCKLIGSTFSCQNVGISLDRNSAAGGLSLNFGKARPAIVGTLAATSLDLTPYLGASSAMAKLAAIDGGPALPAKSNPGIAASLAGYELTMPIIKQFDADIRLSATSVRLSGFQMGNIAAAITLRAGKLQADIAEVKMEGGRASGQITADMNGGMPRYGLRGKFEGIDITRIASGLMGAGALEGRATLVLDLEGSGRTAGQLIAALSGKGHLAMADGGSIGIDPRALVNAVANKESDPLGKAQQRASLYEAEAKFTIQNNVLSVHETGAKTGDLEICCLNGEFNLLRRTLDLKLMLGKPPAADPTATTPKAAACQIKAQEADVLHLQGLWRRPAIRLEPRAKRTDMTPQPIAPGNG